MSRSRRFAVVFLVVMWAWLVLLPLGATLTQQAPLMDSNPRSSGPAILSISVPQSTPNTASDVVDRAYPGLAMSMHSFHEYSGNKSSPNVFSRNLINEIAKRTGTNVHIRVGGTSGDFAVYAPNQAEALTLPPGAVPGGIPRGMRKGPTWFEGFANFPGVKWTYMAHMADDKPGMLENSVLDVQEAMKYIGSDLEALEIGNEIDFYRGSNRPSTYNAMNYLDNWNKYEEAITDAVGEKSYQAPVFANNNFPFSIQNVFDKGQNSKGNVKSAALHNYMTGANLPVSARQSVFMNHTNIAKRLDPYRGPIAYLKANHPNIPLHLAEVNSDTFSMNNEPVIGVFGSTLWLADYLLYGTTLNINRMNVQQSTGFSYTSWRGTAYWGKPAAVLPSYYAHPFVADVIGSSGAVRILDLALGRDLFSGYAVYDTASNKVVKVVLINLQDWTPAAGGARPVQDVEITIGPVGAYGGSFAAEVKKLTAPSADTQDAGLITWAEQSWTLQSQGLAFQNGRTTESVRGSGGKLTVRVQASEAVLMTL